MSAFVIYQDQENAVPKDKVLQKQPSRRPALGFIRTKAADNRSQKELDGFEKPWENRETQDKAVEKDAFKCDSIRQPLSEIENDAQPKKQTPVKDSVRETPMSVEKSVESPQDEIPEENTLQLEEIEDCLLYRDDVYKYLRELETKHSPKPYYMRRQPDVTHSMRAILVDWLAEVGEEFKLHNETLFMAVRYIDRFLSSMAVVRGKLQLLGTSAMFIASKFEEIYPPEVDEFTYITDNTYTKKQVLRMEHLILKVLTFDLSGPTPYTFVTHISSTVNLPKKTQFLAMYISELTLLESDPYLEINPSLIAAGAIALAQHCLGYVNVWSVDLSKASGYSLHHLALVVSHLNNTHSQSFSLPQVAIREKYKTSKYMAVSNIPNRKLIIRDNGLIP